MNRRTVLVGAGSMVALSGCVDDLAAGVEGSDNDHPIDGLEGEIDEDSEYVSLPYKDYDEDEVDRVRDEAVAFEYGEMFRNIEDYTSDEVYADGEIVQVISGDEYDALFIRVDTGDRLYASWVGDRFIEGDMIAFWGEIIGEETYVTALGSQNSVPAIAVADIELLEEGDGDSDINDEAEGPGEETESQESDD